MGADGVICRHSASGAPHRLADVDPRQRRQRRRRHPRAPHPGAARRVHDAPAARASRGAGGSRSSATCCTAGSPVPTCCCSRRSGRASPSWRRPPCCRSGVEAWPAEVSYDLDAALPKSDVVMMLRVQRERMGASYFPTVREYSRRYGLDGPRVAPLPEHAIVMHPGPMVRGMEIASEVADGCVRRSWSRWPTGQRPDGRALSAARRRVGMSDLGSACE